MNTEELFKEGLLKRVSPSEERCSKSLEISEKYISESRKAISAKIYELAIMASYSAVFHASRAILFKEGISERSHYAVYQYLKERRPAIGEMNIESLDMYRRLRHSVSYGLDTQISKKDVVEALKFAEEFLEAVKKYLHILINKY